MEGKVVIHAARSYEGSSYIRVSQKKQASQLKKSSSKPDHDEIFFNCCFHCSFVLSGG